MVKGEGLLCPGLPSKTWTINEDYHSYSTILMKDRYPKVEIGISWFFKNKINIKWREQKRFNDTDSELENIKVQ